MISESDNTVDPTVADLLNIQEQTNESLSRTFPVPHAIPPIASAGKKRKRSSERTSNPKISQIVIEDISESGILGYNRNLTAVNEGITEVSMPVQRTADKKELITLRVQIAMISDPDGDRPIHMAVAKEDIKLVQKLCSLMLKNAITLDLTNYLRQTPLHLAVMLGNKELVVLLMKYGACVTLRDRRGSSVLHLALKSHAKGEMLGLLLSHSETKSILNSLDYDGYSALHYAVVRNNKTAIRFFHRASADMNVTDGKSGRSPLIHAILNQNIEMVSLLLDSGAVPDIVDYSGRSAFEFALYSSNKQIVKSLERKMAPTDTNPQVPVVDAKECSTRTVPQEPSECSTRTVPQEPSECSTRTRSERIAARSKRICSGNKRTHFDTT